MAADVVICEVDQKMSNEEEGDCPVTEKLCAAYRQIQDEKIKGILTAIYSTGATITVVVTIAEILLRIWRP